MIRSLAFPSASLISLVSLISLTSLVGCAADTTSPEPGIGDEEIAQELRRGAPKYKLTSAAIIGEYNSDEGCAGGFDVCEHVEIRRAGDKAEIAIGQYDPVIARAWERDGVILFDYDAFHGDCDDPGCGNLLRATGVVYGVKKGSAWVPQVKLTVTAEFPYPEDEDSPNGDVKTVIHMKKR